MHYLPIAVAFASFLTTILAAPTPEANLVARAYGWPVKKWQFSRGSDAYDYSFTVSGKKSELAPAFTATCTGQAQKPFAACTLSAEPTDGSTFAVSAKVKIVTDPENPNDSIPRVIVREKYVDEFGLCYETDKGKYDKRGPNQPVGADKGSRFKITDISGQAYCE